MKIPESVAVLAILAAIAARADELKTIEGQIFIVTRSHETVKLALVPVEAYRKADVEQAIQTVDAELKRDRERINNFIGVIDQALRIGEAAEKNLNTAAQTSPYSAARWNAALDASRMDLALSQLKLDADRRRDFLFGASVYLSKLRQSHRATTLAKSDADGKFSIRIPDGGDFALVASTRREVGKDIELYFWLVPAESPRTDLTNENLANSTVGSSLLHVQHDASNGDPSTTEAALQSRFEKIKADHAALLSAIGSALNPKTATTKLAIKVQTPRGEVIIPKGTTLSVISRDENSVQVSYLYGPATVSLSAVDLK